MKDIAVIGAGGFGKEVARLVKDINKDRNEWNLLGYIDENREKHGTALNGDPVLGGFEWLDRNRNNNIWAVCAVGSARSKHGLVKKAEQCGVRFASLIHPGVIRSEYAQIGSGCIVCAGSFLSVNIKIGNHVAINPGCGIGHDTVIGDYSTLMWDVTVSGGVTIGEGCEIGSKSVIIQQRNVGRWSIIGAGAAVVRDIPEFCTAVGVPARPIKRHAPDEPVPPDEPVR